MCVEMEVEIFYHARFVLKVSKHISVLDTLDSAAHFTQQPEFLATEINLLTLKVCHFQSEFTYKEMIHK